MIQKDNKNQPTTPIPQANKKPNDTGSVSVEGFIRIFDPKTQEVLVEKRA